MHEKTIFKVSLIVTVLGLLLLFLLAEETTLPSLETVDNLPSNKPVSLEGIVTKLTKKETVYFITLDSFRREKTSIILFPEEEIFLKEGNFIRVEGAVQEYKGENEIIASKIENFGEIKTEVNNSS